MTAPSKLQECLAQARREHPEMHVRAAIAPVEQRVNAFFPAYYTVQITFMHEGEGDEQNMQVTVESVVEMRRDTDAEYLALGRALALAGYGSLDDYHLQPAMLREPVRTSEPTPMSEPGLQREPAARSESIMSSEPWSEGDPWDAGAETLIMGEPKDVVEPVTAQEPRVQRPAPKPQAHRQPVPLSPAGQVREGWDYELGGLRLPTPPFGDDGPPASDKQRSFLIDLTSKAGWHDYQDFCAFIENLTEALILPDQPTMKEASWLIKVLKESNLFAPS